MTASNHTVTGAVIGAAIANPYVALPVAFFSHFFMDMLPHYDYNGDEHTTRRFLYVLFTDIGILSGFLLFILLSQPVNWPIIVASALIAASPDLGWAPYWIAELRGKPREFGPISAFLKRIQFERPWGIYVEIPWFIAMTYIFLRLTS